MYSPAAPPAAPAPGAAPSATEQRARCLELLARLDAQAAAAPQRPYHLAPPRSTDPLDDLATDPCRWQGFL